MVKSYKNSFSRTQRYRRRTRTFGKVTATPTPSLSYVSRTPCVWARGASMQMSFGKNGQSSHCAESPWVIRCTFFSLKRSLRGIRRVLLFHCHGLALLSILYRLNEGSGSIWICKSVLRILSYRINLFKEDDVDRVYHLRYIKEYSLEMLIKDSNLN